MVHLVVMQTDAEPKHHECICFSDIACAPCYLLTVSNLSLLLLYLMFCFCAKLPYNQFFNPLTFDLLKKTEASVKGCYHTESKISAFDLANRL